MTDLHESAARHPGRMTAAMRVLPVISTPKVLRIGVADQGRIVDERLIKQHGDVTVGAQESCTFVVASPVLPSTYRLFEHDSKGYHLNFLEGMTGTVVLPDGARELESLKIQANRRMDGSYRVALSDSSRGKIVMGRTAVLFQFVDQPLPAPKPQLPTSVRAGMSSQIDWRFTVIASFSFVLHFGLLGMVYSDWADQQIDDVATITGVVDSVMSLPNLTPPPDTRVHDVPSEASPTAPQPEKPGGRIASNAPNHGAQPGPGRPSDPGAAKHETNAKLWKQLDDLDVGVVATLGGAGPATQGVLKPGENPMGPLEQLAGKASGVKSSNGLGLNLGSGGERVTPGGGQDGFGSLVPPPGTAAPATTGSAVVVKPPPAGTVVATPQPAGPKIGNLEVAVGRLRPGFRQCYMRQGLEVNPDMEGSVRLTIQVGPNGEVSNAFASASGSISAAVSNCIVGVGRRAQFDPPEGGVGTTVVVPIQLRHQ
ncbi:MAG: AgmX/PglI C-terminal domain-containing protein [Deltaproteobacteria bacterium]|nr:AgmX/PglI C-terminal domain-containing protein [Deltaproteobacteria bacterium]